MTLSSMSAEYRTSAKRISTRLSELRQMKKVEIDPEKLFWINRSIAQLTPILTQMRELAELTEKYYDPGHYRNPKYTMNGITIAYQPK